MAAAAYARERQYPTTVARPQRPPALGRRALAGVLGGVETGGRRRAPAPGEAQKVPASQVAKAVVSVTVCAVVLGGL